MTKLSSRRWATFFVALAACALPLGSAQATPDSENAAIAVIEEDEGHAFDFAWDLDREQGDDALLHVNSATARASCLHCGATAIAFQIVIAVGSPATVVPQNMAEAVNLECTECVVVAEARQFVLVVPDPVQFTGAGRAVLSDVRAHLATLDKQGLPPDQLHQAVEAQEARVRQVLGTQLVLESDPDTEAAVLERQTLQAVEVG